MHPFIVMTCSCLLSVFLSGEQHTVRGARPGKNVQLTETEIKSLCMKSREIFLSQPILLELEAPLKICGTLLITQMCIALFALLPDGGREK